MTRNERLEQLATLAEILIAIRVNVLKAETRLYSADMLDALPADAAAEIEQHRGFISREASDKILDALVAGARAIAAQPVVGQEAKFIRGLARRAQRRGAGADPAVSG